MYDKLKGIVLNTVRYSDRNNIVHVYTDGHGLMSFAVPQGNTRGARMRNAMLMPLSLVEMEAHMMPGREIATMRDLRPAEPLNTLYADPVKSAIAMFISEVLTHVIQEREQNTALFTYIYSTVQLLEHTTRGIANFHICFLFRLGTLLGIEPDVASYRAGYAFDLNEGTFVSQPSVGHRYLAPGRAQTIMLLTRMRFDNLHLFKFNRDQRNEVLDTILDYYKIHNSTLGTLRSPDILRHLFV